MAGAGASEGFEAFPLTLVLAFCREVVRERVRPSSLCICGSYATGKLKLGMVGSPFLLSLLLVGDRGVSQ
jgi:hypothetical protein